MSVSVNPAVAGIGNNTVQVTGGTVDGAVIGGITPAAITGTVVTGATRLVGPLRSGQRLLGKLTGANLNTTADQAIAVLDSTKYLVTSIVVTNVSTSLTLAAGGVYTAASKGGTPIVAATQVYSALTGTPTQLLPLTIAAAGLVLAATAQTLYFSLTTGQGSAATGDVYVFGLDIS